MSDNKKTPTPDYEGFGKFADQMFNELKEGYSNQIELLYALLNAAPTYGLAGGTILSEKGQLFVVNGRLEDIDEHDRSWLVSAENEWEAVQFAVNDMIGKSNLSITARSAIQDGTVTIGAVYPINELATFWTPIEIEPGDKVIDSISVFDTKTGKEYSFKQDATPEFAVAYVYATSKNLLPELFDAIKDENLSEFCQKYKMEDKGNMVKMGQWGCVKDQLVRTKLLGAKVVNDPYSMPDEHRKMKRDPFFKQTRTLKPENENSNETEKSQNSFDP